ncbi:hypothetical protein ACLOJK_012267 [Asimina triloba]
MNANLNGQGSLSLSPVSIIVTCTRNIRTASEYRNAIATFTGASSPDKDAGLVDADIMSLLPAAFLTLVSLPTPRPRRPVLHRIRGDHRLHSRGAFNS